MTYLTDGQTQTSQAAGAIAARYADTHEEMIHQLFKMRPMTCYEIEQETGLKHQTASARMVALKSDGRIYDTGERRRTSGNATASVWCAK